ncbi:CDP-glycerol glycerophosphotransferase family protein [Alkalihalobacterium alkalinitrilicum]|uniref:CDP-glycerol glycerophosphotransferase family protein n=1 Tax=Alkalihalobacterium alkalinitrilicum TaxID=427920 RepID=UPI000995A265|nr:CDP-glycerol glycerophosphotransferase family protein [Alkalihalobacterium alkalinitrilicum]
MNTFYRNYWSLFVQFIEDFYNVKYKNIPLPLLSAFHFYLDDDLKRQMREVSFSKVLRTKIIKENQIQSHFDLYLNNINQHNKLAPPGKILIHEGDLLRFPQDYLRSFDKRTTELLFSSKMKNTKAYHKHLKNLKEIGKVHLLDNHRENVENLKNQYIAEIKSLFAQYKEHIVYSNENFKQKFIEDIPVMVDLLVAYENFFNKVPISCVIVGNTSGMFSRILTLIANSKGIPTICTQHGIIASELGYLPAFASKYAVYGYYEKEWYLKKGVPSDSIEITGHPRFDHIFTNEHMSKQKLIKLLNIGPKKKLVFIATNFNRELNIWSTFIKELQKNPFITIIIKPHPTEERRLGIQHYKELSAKYNSVKLVPASMNLYDIIANVDVVVQELSTAGLEAMLFNKPVFCLRKKDYYDQNDRYYYEKLTEFSETNPKNLSKIIVRFLNDGKMQKHNKLRQKEFLSFAYPQTLSGDKIHNLLHKVTYQKSYSSKAFEDGTIVKGTEAPIYLIYKGKKHHILSPFIFKKLGCKVNDVLMVSDQILKSIPDGSNINRDNLFEFIRIRKEGSTDVF